MLRRLAAPRYDSRVTVFFAAHKPLDRQSRIEIRNQVEGNAQVFSFRVVAPSILGGASSASPASLEYVSAASQSSALQAQSHSLFVFRSPASNMRTRCSFNGRRMVNANPLPSVLSIASSPPCSRTIRRTISNPRPVPLPLVV